MLEDKFSEGAKSSCYCDGWNPTLKSAYGSWLEDAAIHTKVLLRIQIMELSAADWARLASVLKSYKSLLRMQISQLIAAESASVLKSVESVKIQANLELVTDLRKMVNASAGSDVVFVCKDGERVQACRALLVRRSEVLKCMLMNGMAESNSSEVKLPEISSRVLLSIFEFLYTGDILDYPLLSWRMACEVMSAARFFMLPTLEKIVDLFLVTQTCKVGEDLAQAALMLNEAMEFKSLFEDKQDVLLELIKVLSPRLQPIHVHGLSEDALDYLLTNTRSIGGDD